MNKVIEKKEEKEEKEKCVLCGNETEYLKSTPIDERECYVVGCGQLCGGCYGKIY